MSNKNNNQNTNVEEKKEQQEDAPVNEANKTEAQKPAEQKDGEMKKFLCWEYRKAPKKDKASDDKTKPAKNGKWGWKKAVTVATVGVTAITAATKVAMEIIDHKYSGGDGGYSGEDERLYEQQAIEGQYQEVPAASESSEEN